MTLFWWKSREFLLPVFITSINEEKIYDLINPEQRQGPPQPSTQGKGCSSLRPCVCLFVCLNQNGWNYNLYITKLATGTDSPSWVLTTDLILGTSQGLKVQKYISVEGDQVADMSLHSIECPSSS